MMKKILTTFDDLGRRRELKRLNDDSKLAEAVRDGRFNWDVRYDSVYVLQWARDNEIKASRLNKSIIRIDIDWRNHNRVKDEK